MTLKTTPKADVPVEVDCDLCNCLYYERAVGPVSSGRALCSHPHKRQFLLTERCPLYQLEWTKNADRLPVKK